MTEYHKVSAGRRSAACPSSHIIRFSVRAENGRVASRDRTHQGRASVQSYGRFHGSHSARFLLSSVTSAIAPDDDAAEGSSRSGRNDDTQGEERGGGKLSGSQRKRFAKEERKKHRGANKGRRFARVQDDVELCWKVATGRTCEFGAEYVISSHPMRCA